MIINNNDGEFKLYMKKFILIVLPLILAAAFMGCEKAPDDSNLTLDISAAASYLRENLMFDDAVEKLDESIVSAVYNFGGIKTVVYAGSGAAAEEIIVIEAENPEAAKSISEGAVISHWKTRVGEFKEYNVSEQPKLEAKVIVVRGKYIVYCVCVNYDEAEDIINAYIDGQSQE